MPPSVVLEWYDDGAPHWHFIETEEGKAGQIENERLLRHWDHGLVFESFIRSERNWRRFTDYCVGNGYQYQKAGAAEKIGPVKPQDSKEVDGIKYSRL